MEKPCTQKITSHCGKKLKKIQISGSTYCVHEYEELTSLKPLYYPKQSRDSTGFLSEYQPDQLFQKFI